MEGGSSFQVGFDFFGIFTKMTGKLLIEHTIPLVNVRDLFLGVEHPPSGEILSLLHLPEKVILHHLESLFGHIWLIVL